MMNSNYVLVTAARNEERVLEKTLHSVASQTVLPAKWVIISDGSTDGTDEIAQGFASANKFITFLRRDEASGQRSFGSKASALKTAYEQLRGVAYDYVGNLDADVSFAPNYYESVLDRFRKNPQLGIAGGIIHELVDDKFEPQRNSLNSVAGAVQMFRRICYEQIGGYLPLRFGGIDSAAEIMARSQGWEVRTFPDLEVRHYRRVASGGGSVVRTRWAHGMRHYALGYHPAFEMLRNLYRVPDRPYVIGAVLMSLGYVWAAVTGKQHELPAEVVQHLRSEQVERLKSMFFNRDNTPTQAAQVSPSKTP